MTSWSSTYLYLEEWIQRDAYVQMSILLNVINPNGLGMQMNSTEAKMWTSLLNHYGKALLIGVINARANLKSTRMKGGDDLNTYLQNMCLLWKQANNEGVNINKTTY